MVSITCPACGKDISLEVAGKKESVIVPIPYEKPFVKPSEPNKLSESIPMVNTERAKEMRTGINITGEIINKSSTRTINLKSGGTLDTCDAFLVDKFGEIKIQLWGEDVKRVDNGSKVKITNGYTNTFKGEVSLTKGKYGSLEIII